MATRDLGTHSWPTPGGQGGQLERPPRRPCQGTATQPADTTLKGHTSPRHWPHSHPSPSCSPKRCSNECVSGASSTGQQASNQSAKAPAPRLWATMPAKSYWQRQCPCAAKALPQRQRAEARAAAAESAKHPASPRRKPSKGKRHLSGASPPSRAKSRPKQTWPTLAEAREARPSKATGTARDQQKPRGTSKNPTKPKQAAREGQGPQAAGEAQTEPAKGRRRQASARQKVGRSSPAERAKGHQAKANRAEAPAGERQRRSRKKAGRGKAPSARHATTTDPEWPTQWGHSRAPRQPPRTRNGTRTAHPLLLATVRFLLVVRPAPHPPRVTPSPRTLISARIKNISG